MNSLQRYLGTVCGEPVDFLPRLPILMQYAAEYIGSNYGAFASDYRVLTEANLRCAADFGIDQMNTMSDPYRETSGFGGEIEFVRDGVPRCAHPPLEGHQDLSRLPRPETLTAPRMRDRLEAVRTYKAKVGGQASIMGWVEGPAAEAADLRGVSQFFMDLLDDEVWVGELMDLCVEVALPFAKVQIEAGAETIGIGDAVASQVSPDVYERLIQPREKKLVAGLREMGALVRMHICGNITHLLPGLADLDLNILDVDHMVDMTLARETMPRKVVLAGNVDPATTVRFGTPEAIRAHVEHTYSLVGNPYMVNAGCEIPSGTPLENLKALCEPLAYHAD